MLPHEDNVLNKFRIWKERHIQMRENRSSHLVGWKTHPTILPRPGIELTTSRSPRRQHDQGVLRLNHSATAAVLMSTAYVYSAPWYTGLYISLHHLVYLFHASANTHFPNPFRAPHCRITNQQSSAGCAKISHSTCRFYRLHVFFSGLTHTVYAACSE